MAFCASLSTSVAVCSGEMNRVMRNRNASRRPGLIDPPTPSSTPTTTTAAIASEATSSVMGKVKPIIFWARVWAARWALDGGVDPDGRALLGAVGADDRAADDRLADRRQGVAGAFAHRQIVPRDQPLELRQREDQRQEQPPHDQGELPGVEGHQRRRDHELAARRR